MTRPRSFNQDKSVEATFHDCPFIRFGYTGNLYASLFQISYVLIICTLNILAQILTDPITPGTGSLAPGRIPGALVVPEEALAQQFQCHLSMPPVTEERQT